MDEQLLEEQLEQRIKLIESSSGAEHLVDDLPVLDIVVSVVVLALMTVVLLWWAY